jgi:hypothetical protein
MGCGVTSLSEPENPMSVRGEGGDGSPPDCRGAGQKIAVLEERVGHLAKAVAEDRQLIGDVLTHLDSYMQRMESKLEQNLQDVKKDIKDLDARLASTQNLALTKPSWPVALAITGLVSLCVALVTWLVRAPR